MNQDYIRAEYTCNNRQGVKHQKSFEVYAGFATPPLPVISNRELIRQLFYLETKRVFLGIDTHGVLRTRLFRKNINFKQILQ